MASRLLTVVRIKPVTGRIAAHAAFPLPRTVAPGDWRPCLDQLISQLKSLKAGNATVKLVLANEFLQYLLIPRAGLRNQDIHNQLILKHYFSTAFGKNDIAWDFAADQGTSSASPWVLATAIESSLISAIRTEIPGAGFNLSSVQPAFAVGVNRWRKHLQSGLQWLVMVDFDSACISIFRDGHCIHIKRLSGFLLNPKNLIDVLHREKVLADIDSKIDDVLLYSPYQPWTSIPASETLRIRRIRFAPGRDLLSAGVDVPVALAA